MSDSDPTHDRDTARSGAGRSDGPHPGGVEDADSAMPSGAVVGEAGMPGLEPGAADPGGGGDMGADTQVEHDDDEPGPANPAGG